MLCDECNNNHATVHLVSIVNGEKQERNLCADCARKLGTNSFSPFCWGDMFAFAPTPSRSQPKKCSSCGTTLDEFERTGMLGCAQCYIDLREGILPVIKRLQGRVQHVGRAPLGYEAAKLKEPEDVQQKEQIKEEGAEGKAARISALKEALKQAVDNEEFEKAAELRDSIRALEN